MHWNREVIILSILVNSLYSRLFIIGPSEVILTKAETCPEYKNLPIHADFKLRMVNKSYQTMDVKIFVPTDLTEDISLSIKCGRIEDKRLTRNAFTLEEDNLCESLNKRVGPLWWYIQREIGMNPGKCPIKKGNYSVNNLYLDMSKMKIQMIIEGKIFSRTQFMRGKKPVACLDFELVTKPKDTA